MPTIMYGVKQILDRLPVPLLRDIADNRCVPIIGSGFSKNAELPNGTMPDWLELSEGLRDELSANVEPFTTNTGDTICYNALLTCFRSM
jgi:hypothetical protein